jgi:hypothetical protein
VLVQIQTWCALEGQAPVSLFVEDLLTRGLFISPPEASLDQRRHESSQTFS